MSDQPAKPGAGEPKGGLLKWSLWGVALIGVAAVVYIMAQASTKPPAPQGSANIPPPADAHSVAKLLAHPADGTPGPDYAFNDAAGKPMKIADLKGKVVVMNLWATWCGPCQIEMPELAKLQAAYAGKPVAIVAVSIDKPEALDKAKAFIAKQAPLAFYNDPEAKLIWAVKPAAGSMPTTVIYGRDGLERGRIEGPADWAAPAAKALIDKVLAES
jgi:thiol-disulfide isomerase/thioredoxin